MRIPAGSTDVTTYFVIRTAADGTATTGATITDIDLQYTRSGAAAATKVDATALAAADSAHADNKAFEVDGTSSPGLYRVDWPDAAFAEGAPEVIVTVKLASSFTEHLRIELDNGNHVSPYQQFKNATYDDDGEVTAAEIHVYYNAVNYVSDTADEILDYTATVTNGQVTAWSIKKQ